MQSAGNLWYGDDSMIRSCKQRAASETMLESSGKDECGETSRENTAYAQRRQQKWKRHYFRHKQRTNPTFTRISSIARRLISPPTVRGRMSGALINWTASHNCCLTTRATSMTR